MTVLLLLLPCLTLNPCIILLVIQKKKRIVRFLIESLM